MTSEFYRRRWDEVHPDHEGWGASTWYFEVIDDEIIRQVEVYDTGTVLRYGPDHVEDEHGHLGYGGFANGEDWTPWVISEAEFENRWRGQ